MLRSSIYTIDLTCCLQYLGLNAELISWRLPVYSQTSSFTWSINIMVYFEDSAVTLAIMWRLFVPEHNFRVQKCWMFLWPAFDGLSLCKTEFKTLSAGLYENFCRDRLKEQVGQLDKATTLRCEHSTGTRTQPGLQHEAARKSKNRWKKKKVLSVSTTHIVLCFIPLVPYTNGAN